VLVHDGEQRLVESLGTVGKAHAAEAEIEHGAQVLAELSTQNLAALEPLRQRYAEKRELAKEHEPPRFFTEPMVKARPGPIGLLRDLQDLLQLVAFIQSSWTVVDQGAKAMKDERLKSACEGALHHNELQQRWLRTQLKVVSPQALLMAS
jgi:hypothetical protein